MIIPYFIENKILKDILRFTNILTQDFKNSVKNQKKKRDNEMNPKE